MNEMHKCSTCGEEKSRDDFWKNRHTKSGLCNSCIVCEKKRNAKRVTPSRSKGRTWKRSLPTDGITLREKQRRVASIKEATPCVCCGEFHPPKCMDYHHLNEDDKSFSISSIRLQKADTITMEDILKEIRKCVLVCATCHRKIHAGLVELLPA